jgi:hypothetical protein
MQLRAIFSCLLIVGCATSNRPPKIAATTNKSPEATDRSSGDLDDSLTPAQEARKRFVRQQVIRATADFEKAGIPIPGVGSNMLLPHEIELPIEIAEIVAFCNEDDRGFLEEFYVSGEMENLRQAGLADLAFLLMSGSKITLEKDRPSIPGWIWIQRQRIRRTTLKIEGAS